MMSIQEDKELIDYGFLWLKLIKNKRQLYFMKLYFVKKAYEQASGVFSWVAPLEHR